MKEVKGLILVLFIIVMMPLLVLASNINIECENTEVKQNETLSCSLYLENIENAQMVEFTYNTNFDITFQEESGISISNDFNKLNITINSANNVIKLAGLLVKAKSNMVDENTIVLNDIKVTKEDSIVNVPSYTKTIKVNKVLSDDCYLSSIIINDTALENFSWDVFEYHDIVVNNQLAFVDAKGRGDSSISGLGRFRVKPSVVTTRVIHVVAENGDYKDYTLYLTYEEPRTIEDTPVFQSSDNTLSTLELYDGNNKLNFNFDKTKTVFDYTLEDDIENVEIKATLNDNKASFDNNFGPRVVKLYYGKTIYEIKVRAENNEARIYTLNLYRVDKRSDDATLKSLKINDIEVPLVKNKFDYTINVASDVIKTNTDVVTNNEKASVIFNNIELKEGDNNLVIKVVAENGNSHEYKVKIVKLPEEELETTGILDITLPDEEQEEGKVALKNIIVSGYDLMFDINKQTYDITLNGNEDKLDIIIVPDMVESEIFGNNELKDNSKITINIKDDNGASTYTLNIHIANKDNVSIFYYIFFGFSVLTFILSLVRLLTTKKKS